MHNVCEQLIMLHDNNEQMMHHNKSYSFDKVKRTARNPRKAQNAAMLLAVPKRAFELGLVRFSFAALKARLLSTPPPHKRREMWTKCSKERHDPNITPNGSGR